jgi:hypothetical protein
MQKLPHGLPLRHFGFLFSAAALLLRQVTQVVLTRVTGHPFRLRIAVCHSLLLRLIWALVLG